MMTTGLRNMTRRVILTDKNVVNIIIHRRVDNIISTLWAYLGIIFFRSCSFAEILRTSDPG